MLLDCPVAVRLFAIAVTALAVGAPAAQADQLYWANDIGGTTVRRCDLGSLPCNPQTVASNQADPFGVAVNSSHVYWTTSDDNTIRRCAVGASMPCTGAGGGER